MTAALDRHLALAQGAMFAPGYWINKDGAVLSMILGKPRILTAHPNSHGYLRIRAAVNGVRTSFFIHKLVALHFVGARPGENYEVRHLDGDKTNNHYSNLAWGTRAPMTFLTPADVEEL